jgi:carbon-monoxide dehydrogenase large subunit
MNSPKASVPKHRHEDERFVTGKGTFTDDISVPGQAYAHFVRSHHAHGILRRVDTAEARAMRGVLGVFTGADLEAAGIAGLPFLPIPGFDLGDPVETPRPALASRRVRYVGEQIALVVAETHAQAMDAAERVRVEVDALPPVTGIEASVAPGAPQLWPAAPGNVILRWEFGNTPELERAFAQAAHVTKLRVVNNRVAANPIEPRALVAAYDRAADQFQLNVSSQGVIYYRRALLEGTFRLKPDQVHILTHDVGGAFGSKEFPYPEDIAVMHAARVLGRPVKWTGTRREQFLSDNHGRDAVIECALALDAGGQFLALRADAITSLGAYCSFVAPTTAVRNFTFGLPLVYCTPLIATMHRLIVTNAAPTGPYRGAGREQAALAVECTIDQAARELGIDPVDLRRRNLIETRKIPYRTPLGRLYESGDFPGVLDKTIWLADWNGFDARRRASEAKGRIRGRGLALFVEFVGGVPFEGCHLRFESDGSVVAVVATQSQGQGHETSFAQVMAEKLGIPYESVRIRQGDSADVPRGMGSFASRSMIMAGSAIAVTCDAAIKKGQTLAAALFGMPEDAVYFRDGMFRALNSNQAIDIRALAGHAAASLDSSGEFTVAEFHCPNGGHACEVEIDPETGHVSVDRYAAVDDVGVLINPAIVHGQIHGGVAQGLGQTLLEQCAYDASGQLLSATFMDYAMPRAGDFPEPSLAFHVVRSTANPLGVKGCGESGVTGSIAAVCNAVADALVRAGVAVRIEMPFTSEKVWRALQTGVGKPARGRRGGRP